jgi:hypothetical protein
MKAQLQPVIVSTARPVGLTASAFHAVGTLTRVGFGAVFNPFAAIQSAMKATQKVILGPGVNRAMPPCPPGTVRSRGGNCVSASGTSTGPSSGGGGSGLAPGAIRHVGASGGCPPGTVRHTNGTCVYAPSFGDPAYTTQAGSGLPNYGMGALPSRQVTAVGVGAPTALADPVGNIFSAIARALTPNAHVNAPLPAASRPATASKVNYANGARYAQAAWTFLNRNPPDYQNARNNIVAAWKAAGFAGYNSVGTTAAGILFSVKEFYASAGMRLPVISQTIR